MFLQRRTIERRALTQQKRRGGSLVLIAIMLIVLCGCTALCIDIGWTALAKSELQNAADASAAAGSAQLLANYGAYSLPSQSDPAGVITSAKSSAMAYCTQYAGFNKAGEVSSLNLRSSDVQFGFMDGSGNVTYGTSSYPNTVQVIVRRDSYANAALPLFFAPVIGTQSWSLTATASSTIYTGVITSFNPNGGGVGSSFSNTSAGGGSGSSGAYGGWGSSYAHGSGTGSFNCTLLPVAFDVNDWNAFMASGVSPDGGVHDDANNTPQIKVYPSPKNSPGNFGLLCIGPWTNATPDYEDWILNGPSAADLQTLIDEGLFPVSQAAPQPWKGSPGLRSTLSSYFTRIIGKPRLLPLFAPAASSPYQAASGSGSNTTYAIVGFAGVKVTSVSGSGSSLNISVQPCDVIDPTAVFDAASVYPAGTEPATQLHTFSHPAPKFTY